MNYIWEVLYRAKKQGIPAGDIVFVQTPTPNPYQEVVFSDINNKLTRAGEIEINGYYRYDTIFEPMLRHSVAQAHPELIATLFDIVAHDLGERDLQVGLSRAEWEKQLLQEELVGGAYGRGCQEVWSLFSEEEAGNILAALRKQNRLGTSMALFTQLLKQLYKNFGSYLDTENNRELLLYIGAKQTLLLERQVTFLCELFIPLDIVVQIFWDKHFGIIGVEETMMIEDMMLYG